MGRLILSSPTFLIFGCNSPRALFLGCSLNSWIVLNKDAFEVSPTPIRECVSAARRLEVI
jgi:hypothetical protein